MEGESSKISILKKQPCNGNQELDNVVEIHKESKQESKLAPKKIAPKKIAPNVSLDLDLSEKEFNIARLKLNLSRSKSGSSQSSGSSLAKLIIKRNADDKVYPCKFCDHKFYSCQALGGHQNGHKRERINEKRKLEESNAGAISKNLRTDLNLYSSSRSLPFNNYSGNQSSGHWPSVNSRIQNPQLPTHPTIPRWGSSWLENNRFGMAHQYENGGTARTPGSSSSLWDTPIPNTTGATVMAAGNGAAADDNWVSGIIRSNNPKELDFDDLALKF